MALAIATILVAVIFAVRSVPPGAKPVAPPRPANPYRGLGAWVDMYSWSETFTGGAPRFGPEDLTAMAAAGVQTLYLQAAQQVGPLRVLEPARVDAMITAAHKVGISVVVWYQPTLENVATDLARLLAVAHLPADAVAVDIESTDVAAVATRNSALVALSQQLRHALPGRLLGAVVLPAPFLQAVNPAYWPGFPYEALAASYDAWLPMVYWTDRLASSGYRDGYRYTLDSVTELRDTLGATTVISPIGGVSVAGLSLPDLSGFVAAVRQTGSGGGSLYEWPGTTLADWTLLRPLRTKTTGGKAPPPPLPSP